MILKLAIIYNMRDLTIYKGDPGANRSGIHIAYQNHHYIIVNDLDPALIIHEIMHLKGTELAAELIEAFVGGGTLPTKDDYGKFLIGK